MNLKPDIVFTLQVLYKGTAVLSRAQLATVGLRLTIPFGCQPNVSSCYLDVNVFMPRTDRCEIADVGLQQSSANPCGIRFFNNETGVTKQLTLQAIVAPRTALQKRLITAKFFTQPKYNAHPIFGGYNIDTLAVSSQFDFPNRINATQQFYS